MTAATSGSVSDPIEWLVLTHQLPSEPAYFRVKVHRRLERIGAVPLKNSVYVLPPGDETQEDFEWLREEIIRGGGESTLSRARFLDSATDARLIAAFRSASGEAYESIVESARALLEHGADEPDEAAHPERIRPGVAGLRRSLADAVARDHFGAEGRTAAEGAIHSLEALVGAESSPVDATPDLPTARTWVTRSGVGVDRMASAWLIRRFIDPAASFAFVASEGYQPVEGELRFDMYEGEFTHEGDACTFEVLLSRFGLDDVALRAIAEMVHDLDFKDDKFGREEAAGLASMLAGVVKLAPDDAQRLERSRAVFESLYAGLSGTSG